MIVLGKDKVTTFLRRHPQARSLLAWLRVLEGCQARHPVDLKKTFNSVDPVPPQTVFDVGGNNYRVITRIDYESQIVVVTHVLTHREYSKGKWRV